LRSRNRATYRFMISSIGTPTNSFGRECRATLMGELLSNGESGCGRIYGRAATFVNEGTRFVSASVATQSQASPACLAAFASGLASFAFAPTNPKFRQLAAACRRGCRIPDSDTKPRCNPQKQQVLSLSSCSFQSISLLPGSNCPRIGDAEFWPEGLWIAGSYMALAQNITLVLYHGATQAGNLKNNPSVIFSCH